MPMGNGARTAMARTIRVVGVLWLLLGTGVLIYYVARFLSGNLDSYSLMIVIVYSLLGVAAGVFLIGRMPGRLVLAIIVSLVYGVREFTYLFHTLPVPINPDSVRGFVVLLFALCTIALVIAERRGSARAANVA